MNPKSGLTIVTLDTPHLTDFAAARNAALARAKTDWVLFLDSDETLSPELKQEISSIIHRVPPKSRHGGTKGDHPSSIPVAYYLRRRDFFLGRELKHGETGHSQFIRLARRDFGRWVRPVHEVWAGEGSIGELTHPLLHSPHPTIASFLTKIDRYSTLEAEYRFAQGSRASLWHLLVYPLAKFKLNYLLRLGFLDGVPGIIHAAMMSFHSYLTWSKLYHLQHSQRITRSELPNYY